MTPSPKKSPLSHAVAASILSQTNPNERIRWLLSNRELSKIERQVPFKCDCITIDDTNAFTKINKVTYDLGIIRKYEKEEKMPEFARRTNAAGGLTELIRSSKEFKIYIKLRVGDCYEEHLKCNKSLGVAHRAINNFLFGNRGFPIEAKRLIVGGQRLLLPKTAKFQIKELDMGSVNSMKHFGRLATFLAPSSFPLEHLNVYVQNEKDTYDKFASRIKDVKSIFVGNNIPGTSVLLKCLMALHNKTITSDNALSNKHYVSLVKDWMTNVRDVGSSITFEILHASVVNRLLYSVKCAFECREKGPGTILISLNQQSRLRITSTKYVGTKSLDPRVQYKNIRMEVEPADGKD